jgi:hypothetical protein
LLQTSPLVNGVASIATNTLPLGVHVVSASYAGSGDFAASTSNNVSVTVIAPNPAPVISSLSPAFTSAGGTAFALTVSGAGFVSGSTVHWGSTALTTQFGNASQLTAQATQAQIASAGITAITVQSPSPGGGTSNALQFEVDSSGTGNAPAFSILSVTVAPGSTATYPVTLSSSATNVSVTCLNLPSGAACSYSSANSTLTIATSSGTPAGAYQITVVFTETLPGAATAFILFPFLILPFIRKKQGWTAQRICMIACAGLALMIAAAAAGCGGGGGSTGSAPPQTHQATTSGVVTLTVQ